jgi:hypothetical protein
MLPDIGGTAVVASCTAALAILTWMLRHAVTIRLHREHPTRRYGLWEISICFLVPTGARWFARGSRSKQLEMVVYLSVKKM